MSTENQKGYSVILEPSIYHELDWDMDLIVSCLNILRRELKLSLDLPRTTTYDLVAFVNFQGQMYPAIGVDGINTADIALDNDDLNTIVHRIIALVGLDNIRNEAIPGHPVTWDRLKELRSYSGE